MNPNIKKLSVLFLVGAILTSSLALGASAIANRSSKDSVALREAGVDSDPGNSSLADGYRIYGAGPNGQNLTDEVANIFARQLVEANPEGPQQNADGNIQLLYPTSTELFAYLESNAPPEEILRPSIDDSRIQVLQDFDADDISRYLNEVIQIQNGVTSSSLWQAGLAAETAGAGATASWISETGKVFADAQDKMYGMPVPALMLPAHKSELAFFSSMTAFSDAIVQDPVAAIALLNKLEEIVVEENATMNRAIEDLRQSLPRVSSASSPDNDSMLATMLGIPKAHAIAAIMVPVSDPLHTQVSELNWFEKFWRDYKQVIISNALGVLKNTLVQQIGQRVIEWAEGVGIPGYVTNWAMYLVDAGISAKLGLISSESARLCGNAATTGLYGDVLASAFGAPTRALGVTGVNQTIGETRGCPQVSTGFYNRRGHSAEHFLQSLTHNTYNDVLRLRNRSIRVAGAASQAAVHEALSGRGSLDVKKCDDGSTPGAPPSGNNPPVDPNFVGPPVPPNLRCADGSAARTITPGSAKQDLISKVLGGAQDIIASVNNEDTYAAITQVLTQSLLNAILEEGEGIFSGGGGGGSGGGTTRPPPAPPTASSTIDRQVSWYISNLETALTLATGAKSNSEQARATFQAILDGGACAETISAQILEYISQLDQSIIGLTARVQEVQGLLDAVRQLQQNPPVTQGQLSAVSSVGNVIALVTRSRGDNEAAMEALSAANDLFLSPECEP